MYAWDYRLRVRRLACEFRLDFYRSRHSEITEERSRSPFKGPTWEKKSYKMALLRQFIRRELDEIDFVKRLAMVGPIKGGTLVLHVRDGKTHKVRPGPSIIELIQRKADEIREWADKHIDGTIEQSKLHEKADGLLLALEILNNPYRFLDEDERAAYDAAESNADKITKDAAARLRDAQTIKPPSPPAPDFGQLRAGGARMIRKK